MAGGLEITWVLRECKLAVSSLGFEVKYLREHCQHDGLRFRLSWVPALPLALYNAMGIRNLVRKGGTSDE